MRVYVPGTLPMLRRWAESGQVGPAPLTAFAVTPGLREWYAEGDAEELEYVATLRAARASLRLLNAYPGEPRRVVLAVDVTDVVVRDDLEEGVVHLPGVLSWSAVAAALVDDEAAGPIVLAAADVVDAADLGDDEAEFAIGSVEDLDLLWYASQEVADL